MSAVVLNGWYLSHKFLAEVEDADVFAEDLHRKVLAGIDMELNYAGVADEDREEAEEHVRLIYPVIIRLGDTV
jgi:hypothetical protein